MYRPQLVIHVSGGVVQNVFSSDRDAEIILVDWDVNNASTTESNTVAVELHHRTVLAHVGPLSPLPLHELAGSDLELAVEAAFHQGILAEPACELPAAHALASRCSFLPSNSFRGFAA